MTPDRRDVIVSKHAAHKSVVAAMQERNIFMDKSIESLLKKVTSDRRRFVQTILGMAGYATPTVRSFIMASAVIVPALSAVTTTHAPTTTTTPRPWRPTPAARPV